MQWILMFTVKHLGESKIKNEKPKKKVYAAKNLKSMLAEHKTAITMTFILCYLLSWKLLRDLGQSDSGFEELHSAFNHGCIKSLKESGFPSCLCFLFSW